MQDLLQAVLGVEKLHYGVLRISAPALSIEGRLAVSEARYIVDASITGIAEDYNPYECFRTLLSLPEGNFAFLDAGTDRPSDFHESFYISIEKVIAALPILPEEPNDLFDEKSLLDKVFTANDASNLTARTPEKGNNTRVTNWDIVQPLFDNSNPQSFIITDAIKPETKNPNEQRQSMTRLRSLPKSSSKLKSLLLILVVLLAAVLTTCYISSYTKPQPRQSSK